ncbi:MAG: hydroxymethylglutaryl-CoA reductase [Candidatus Micrarchaeia archaeon]
MMDTDEEKLITKIINGEIAFHKIEEHAKPEDAVRIRRSVVERVTKTKLDNIANQRVFYDKIINKNGENIIGSISIPLGISGPIIINGAYAKGSFYVPMATTEGALIASVSRGMKMLNESGGVSVRIYNDSMARSPVFELESIEKAVLLKEWIEKNKDKLSEIGNRTTSHGKVRSIDSFIVGNNVWIRVSMHTGDAMGMNMLTIASEEICKYIEKSFPGAKLVAVSGNMCSDKKESYINELLGRGKGVVADCLIKKEVLEKNLGVSADRINIVNLKKNMLGSSRAGSSKHNAHFANVIASIFAATGQDIAQVVESSSGYTWTEVRNNSLYISVTLPSLEVGTVGGGTSLEQQKESLFILGIDNKEAVGNNSKKFAEIITAAVLAGELNLLSALAKRELGKAHQKLGRNKGE